MNATTAKWLSKYHDVRTRASLGGVRRFAQAHKLSLKKAQRLLEQDLAYNFAQTPSTPFSHLARDRGGTGRSMGRRFGGSATLGQVQPRGTVPDDRSGCVVQIRVGPTLESQDRGGRGPSL